MSTKKYNFEYAELNAFLDTIFRFYLKSFNNNL